MRVSVVIPTLNESATIVDALRRRWEQSTPPDEVIVVDASSPDGTAASAAAQGAVVLSSPRGRGAQQNRGAVASTGELLVFLHADCRLEPSAIEGLRRFAAEHPRIAAGCFRMRVDSPRRIYRPIERAADFRAGLLGVPYGDQAIFVRRWAFRVVGGFPELPLMEDVGLALRLRRLGRICVLPWRVSVSPRRWEARGPIRQTLVNWSLTVAACAGASPATLARFYPVVR